MGVVATATTDGPPLPTLQTNREEPSGMDFKSFTQRPQRAVRSSEGAEGGWFPCMSNGQKAPTGTPCDDGNACNGAEICDGSGQCLPGNPPTLDDSDPCTFDRCDP